MYKSVICIVVIFSFFVGALNAQDYKEIPRRIPPKGKVLKPEETQKLKEGLKELKTLLDSISHPLKADAEVFYKAVEFAVKHDEFYWKKGNYWGADYNLKEGLKRAKLLQEGKTPWLSQKGMIVRGYYSPVDGSVQPAVLEIPDELELGKQNQLWVWLHGRGEKETDNSFIHKARSGKRKLPTVKHGIVLHPLGRQCIGWKSAGQFDILHAVDFIKSQYKIDENRIALLGFSMGGAGAWQAGAHFTEKWVAVHAGAGFAETAEFTRMKKEDYPAWYEQKLWGVYDMPNYVRNLFNIPVISYSGENDKQIQAARVMEKAYQSFDKKLPHLIGPKMGHKYAEGYLEQIVEFIEKAMVNGRDIYKTELSLQTQTLRYPSMYWIKINGLKEHWQDSRIDAKKVNNNKVELTSKNIRELSITPPTKGMANFPPDFEILIDKQTLTVTQETQQLNLVLVDGNWKIVESFSTELKKTPGLQGPMDDAFNEAFLVVTPSTKSSNPKIQKWIDFELAHFIRRWQEAFRGHVRIKQDSDVTEDDLAKYHIIAWGDFQSNQIIKKALGKLPIQWDKNTLTINDKSYQSANHIPLMGFPNPLNSKKYLVLNTGPTFREYDDGNNARQNPKLPDWAVIDVNTPPDKHAAGKVVDANFFDEFWKFK
ncbi:MAG: prolyl oligopeptidase family serine peptidase [Lentisphaeraceae bacterium]|nr:prolyl oligopeptidase family serine peptidase [Lentisphaeraceae bacterium]